MSVREFKAFTSKHRGSGTAEGGIMRDQHILRYVGASLWAITAEKWAEMLPALVRHARGEKLSAEALEAFLSDQGRPAQPGSSKRGAVAVIPIRGVIAHRMDALGESSGGTSAERIGKMLTALASDDTIGTIVYDIDSPGGTVPGIRELAQQMFELRGVKRQIAVANSLAASAAYWLAAQVDEIVSIPSGSTGSIGVFSAHQDLSALLEKEGVKITLIKAGKFKTENNPFEPLTDEGRAEIQKRVDDAYGQFIKDVARGRGVAAAEVRAGFGEGRTLMAKEAKAAGLIDRISTLDEVIGKLVGKAPAASGARAEDAEPEIAAATPTPAQDSQAAAVRALEQF